MSSPNVYDVTTFAATISPQTDIGQVINEIIADIKARQTSPTTRPGAVVYIPPGDYHLLTTVEIDISFLQIKGSGHGWLTQETRDNDPSYNPGTWRETTPGGSHVIVDFTTGPKSAFHVNRSGDFHQVGRVSGVEFDNFMIDGRSGVRPHNADPFKIGIAIDSNTDSVFITNMGMTYLNAGIIAHSADALFISHNMICEIGNCILLYDYSTSVKVTNNFLLSDWEGASVYAENADNTVITDNTIEYCGTVRLHNCTNGFISGNRIDSGWPHCIYVEVSNDMVISNNHIRRQDNVSFDNGLDDTTGIVYVNGARNSVVGNRITVEQTPGNLRLPSGGTLNAIWVDGGDTHLMMNRISCSTGASPKLWVTSGASNTRIIYSADSYQLLDHSSSSQVVLTP